MREYDPRKYPPFAVTVDLVVLTIREGRLTVLLIRRGLPRSSGVSPCPGFIRSGEALEQAAARELAEEAGLAVGSVHLVERLASYGDPGRDPRMRVVTVAHLALAPGMPCPRAGTDAAEAYRIPVEDILTGGPGSPALSAHAPHRSRKQWRFPEP